jgi:DNA topoisomerase-1
MVQIGDTDSPDKPRFASLQKGQSIDSITLEQALDLFKLPRTLGKYENEDLIVSTGRFGPYVRHNSQFFSLAKTDDPLTITYDRAVEVMLEKKKQESDRILREFPEEPGLRVINGRYGAYISFNKANYKIPKGTKAETLTLEECRKIIAGSEPTKPKRGGKKK